MSRETSRQALRQQFHITEKLQPAALAPLAGYSDLPFRRLCHEQGAGLVTTELVSATGILYTGVEKSRRYLTIDPALEGPVLIQLFGSEPDDFLYAADQILENDVLKQCLGIDVNMGCPVPKVVKSGAGSRLTADIPRAVAIVKKLADLIQPQGYLLSCKIRRGFFGQEETAPELACALVEAGCQILTYHGRFREQYYAGQASWEALARVDQALTQRGLRDRVLYVANGDVSDKDSAEACLKITGADTVAIGRAAQGNPWIFREFAGIYPAEVDLPTQAEGIARHARLLADFLGEELAMKEFRKTLTAYARGRKDARRLRENAGKIDTLEDVTNWLQEFLLSDPSHTSDSETKDK